MTRTLRSSVAIAVALVALAPLTSAFAVGAPTGDDLAACGPQVVIGRDGWARIKSPDYSSGQGDEKIEVSAAPDGLSQRIYVSNGTVVKMSQSAGCKWDFIHPEETRIPVPGEVSRLVVTHLVAPTDKSLWIASYEDSGGVGSVGRPHVARTKDATYKSGATAKPIEYLDDGLPLVGKPFALAVPRLADKGYLLVDEPHDAEAGSAAPARRLYQLTVDRELEPVAGAPRYLWRPAPLPDEIPTPAGLTMSGRQSDTIWVWAGNKYAWSRDAGATWTTRTARGPVTALDVDEVGLAAVFSSAADGGGHLERVDSFTGRVRSVIGTPVAVTAAAHGFYGTYVIHGEKRTYGYDSASRTWIDVSPKPAVEFTDLHFASAAAGRIVLGQTRGHLYRLDLFDGESFVRRPPGEVWIPDGGTGVEYGDPEITPARQVVRVEPGKTADANVDFHVPPSAGRLDVFFLIDTTTSMNAAITGLQTGVRQIADQVVARTRGQACFGVGEVKDFSIDSPLYGEKGLTPYKLHKKITCDIEELSAGLGMLQAGGGDRFPEEAQALGLIQAVTGDGHIEPPVLPGQGAGFEAPTRVIVLITDAGFKLEPEFRGYPTMDETVRTLTSFGHWTHVVGVLLQTDNDLGPAIRDMTEVARRTHTFAPPSGADCNDDGFTDVAPGAPLVCKAENYAPSVAPAIVALLLGVKEPATLGVHVKDDSNVVAGIRADHGHLDPAKKVTTIVNIRVPNTVPFKPVVTCRPDQDGTDIVVPVVGTRRQVAIADAELVVQCRAKPVPLRKRPPVIEDQPEPVPPRPPIVPALVPPFQPPTVNNPPANINPNAGFSKQEEEQYQLAAVSQDASEESAGMEEIELAMSGLAPDDAAARLVLGCAAMTGLGAAVVFGHRRRTQRSASFRYVRRG